MQKKVTREEVIEREPFYKNMLDLESHHNHEIIDKDGRFYWKENPVVKAIVDDMGIGNVIAKLEKENITENHEEWRRLYRGIGYSLAGYEDIFHWEENNKYVSEYKKDGLLEKEFYLADTRI